MRGRKISGRMSKKLVGLFLAVILALVALAVRITYINATNGEQYERIVLSQTQQQYESRTIPFKRGDIVDRNGTILATSERVYNVILDCHVVNTAVEAVVDLVTEEKKPLAKLAKDTAAGAVLIAAIMAAFAGVIIFLPKAAQLFVG